MKLVPRAIGEWDPLSALVAAVRQVCQGTHSHGCWQLDHPVPAMIGWCVLIIAVCVPLALRRFRTDNPPDQHDGGSVDLLVNTLDTPRSATLLPDPEARPIRVPIISVDDHLIEPPDLFEGRLPAALQTEAPRIVEDPSGTQCWVFESHRYPNVGLNAVVGRPRAEWSMEPARFDQMRPGCFDIDQRVADMDLAGIWASLCFPSLVSGFCGSVYSRAQNKDLGLACLRAFNDWHHEVWAGTHPERIIPLQLPYLADVAVACGEVAMNAARGFKAVSFPEFPAQLGLPSIFSGHWDPLLRRLRGDGHRGLPAHRCVVVGAAPVPRPTLRTAPDPVPGQRTGGGRGVAVVRGPRCVSRSVHRHVRRRDRLGAHADGPDRLRLNHSAAGSESSALALVTPTERSAPTELLVLLDRRPVHRRPA